MSALQIPRGTWVAAAPFRSHLVHVLAATSLPWQSLALHAGIPQRVAHALLFGRLGRPLHKLAPDLAHRILCLSDASLAALDNQAVAVEPTQTVCGLLREAGVTDADIARRCHLSDDEFDVLTATSTHFTTRRIELLAMTVAVQVGVVDWPENQAAS